MAVYCEFISLIILRDSIDKYFPGGWTRFVIELPNRSMATDGEVVRVGFMNSIDSSIYLDFLIDEGLQFKQSGGREIDDISDLDQFNGHLDKRSWLEFGYRIFDERKYFCCWLKGSSIETLTNHLKVKRMFRIPYSMTPHEFVNRYEFVRAENGLDIYTDIYTDSERDFEFYMPMGASIEEYYKKSKERRKKIEGIIQVRKERKEKSKKVDKPIQKALDKRVEEKRLIEQKKKLEKKRVAEKRLIELKKELERKRVAKKKAEDELYAKVAKIIKKKTVIRDDPTKVLETLTELAFKTNDQIYLDLIDEFWQFNYGLMFNLMDDGDSFYLTVDPKEIIEQLRAQPEDYFEDESEMSDDDKFNTFKGMVESRFESDDSCELVKPVGKFVLTAYLSDSRENKPLSNFNVWSNSKQVDDYFMNSELFCSEYGGKCNYDDQTMRAYFDKHYLNN